MFMSDEEGCMGEGVYEMEDVNGADGRAKDDNMNMDVK